MESKITLRKILVKKNTKYLINTISLLFLFTLFLLIFTGLNNVLAGDDLVYFKTFESNSIFTFATHNYLHWSGRVANYLILGLIFKNIGHNFLPFTAVLISMLMLFISNYVLIRVVFKKIFNQENLFMPALLSAALSLGLALFSKTTYDNFYWIAGIVTYILPIILFNLTIAFILKFNNIKIYFDLLVFILGLFIGLINEAFVLQSILVCFLLLMVFLIEKQYILIRRLLILTLSLLTSLVVLKLSPGTKIRTGLLQSMSNNLNHDFTFLVKHSLKNGFSEYHQFISLNKLGLTALLLSSLLVGLLLKSRVRLSKKHALYITSTVMASVVMFIILSFVFVYSYSPVVTVYSLITANYFSYISVLIIGLVVGLVLKRYTRLSKYLTLFIFASLIVLNSIFILKINNINQLLVLQRKEYFATQKTIFKQKSIGKTDIILQVSNLYFSYCVPTSNDKVWCNSANSKYYDVNSIKAIRYNEYNSINQVYR